MSETLLKRDSYTSVFCEICEIFENIFFYRTSPVAASVTFLFFAEHFETLQSGMNTF